MPDICSFFDINFSSQLDKPLLVYWPTGVVKRFWSTSTEPVFIGTCKKRGMINVFLCDVTFRYVKFEHNKEMQCILGSHNWTM